MIDELRISINDVSDNNAITGNSFKTPKELDGSVSEKMEEAAETQLRGALLFLQNAGQFGEATGLLRRTLNPLKRLVSQKLKEQEGKVGFGFDGVFSKLTGNPQQTEESTTKQTDPFFFIRKPPISSPEKMNLEKIFNNFQSSLLPTSSPSSRDNEPVFNQKSSSPITRGDALGNDNKFSVTGIDSLLNQATSPQREKRTVQDLFSTVNNTFPKVKNFMDKGTGIKALQPVEKYMKNNFLKSLKGADKGLNFLAANPALAASWGLALAGGAVAVGALAIVSYKAASAIDGLIANFQKRFLPINADIAGQSAINKVRELEADIELSSEIGEIIANRSESKSELSIELDKLGGKMISTFSPTMDVWTDAISQIVRLGTNLFTLMEPSIKTLLFFGTMSLRIITIVLDIINNILEILEDIYDTILSWIWGEDKKDVKKTLGPTFGLLGLIDEKDFVNRAIKIKNKSRSRRNRIKP